MPKRVVACGLAGLLIACTIATGLGVALGILFSPDLAVVGAMCSGAVLGIGGAIGGLEVGWRLLPKLPLPETCPCLVCHRVRERNG